MNPRRRRHARQRRKRRRALQAFRVEARLWVKTEFWKHVLPELRFR